MRPTRSGESSSSALSYSDSEEPLPDITRITRFGFVNAYLVREDDGLTVVDTMLWGGAALRSSASR